MTKRKHISLKEKLAAALWELERVYAVLRRDFFESSWLRRHEKSKGLSAKDYISRFDWDHAVLFAHNGPDHWSNLTPMLRVDHREKTKRDVATIAKGKRIQRKEAAHKAKIGSSLIFGQDAVFTMKSVQVQSKPKRKWPSRPFNKHKRKAK